MKRTTICFVAPYIQNYLRPGESGGAGGAERQQHLIAQKLREEGYEVSFIACQEGRERFERIDGFDVWNVLPGTNDVKWVIPTFILLTRYISLTNADVVYTRGNPPLCILVNYSCKLLNKNFIYSVANDAHIEVEHLKRKHRLFSISWFRNMYFESISDADLVISQTEYQQQLLNDHGIDSVRLPNVNSVPADEQIVPVNERKHFLWVGSLNQDQKRPYRFLEIARNIPAEQFVMVGYSRDQEFQSQIERDAANIPNLDFKGFVPPNEIDEHYRYSKALINTSDYEGFPNTFLEAWQYAVPVISLHFELDGRLTNDDLGFVSGSMNDLITDVKNIGSNPGLAEEMGKQCREVFSQQYTVENYTNKLMEILEHL